MSVEALQAQAEKSRQRLKKFCQLPHPQTGSGLLAMAFGGLCGNKYGPTVREMMSLGGTEGAAVQYRVAMLDKDGDGTISVEELANFYQLAEDQKNRVLEGCLNWGLISALILSFSIPMVMEPPDVSDRCIAWFGAGNCDALLAAYLITLQVVIGVGGFMAFVSSRIFTVITLMLVTKESKFKYVQHIAKLLGFMGVTFNTMMIWCSGTLGFGLLVINPLVGFVQFGLFFVCLLAAVVTETMLLVGPANIILHNEMNEKLRFRDSAPSSPMSPEKSWPDTATEVPTVVVREVSVRGRIS